MRRRSTLLFAVFVALVVSGCQSSRAMSPGSSRLTEPTMTSPTVVPQAGHPTDAPRTHVYDPL